MSKPVRLAELGCELKSVAVVLCRCCVDNCRVSCHHSCMKSNSVVWSPLHSMGVSSQRFDSREQPVQYFLKIINKCVKELDASLWSKQMKKRQFNGMTFLEKHC